MKDRIKYSLLRLPVLRNFFSQNSNESYLRLDFTVKNYDKSNDEITTNKSFNSAMLLMILFLLVNFLIY
ncbi:hypothetical protein [Flavobacterium dankookense]|uniref:Uncharacterized protein n=1 Tax=Flavobacterium dankookense TaxID=706186 RepID=A0A4R6QD28_9FLAO|nr:hypothetical protein [Flavobacterium dankookense]TDP59299.1 hypothetical protein BC748_1546 [Flavobacterium dankookense]